MRRYQKKTRQPTPIAADLAAPCGKRRLERRDSFNLRVTGGAAACWGKGINPPVQTWAAWHPPKLAGRRVCPSWSA